MDKIKKIFKRPAVLLLAVWFTVSWSWVFFADTLNLAGSRRQGLILAALVAVVNVSVSVYLSVKVLDILKYCQNKFKPPLFVLVCIAVFALLDFLIAWMVAIVWIGPEGSIDNVLPIGSMALPLVNTPFKFATRFIGFYGLAGMGWSLVYLLAVKKYRKYSVLPIGLIVVLSVFGYFLYRTPSGHAVNVKIISEKLTDRVASINPEGSDLVVFPEYGLEKINNSNLEDRIKMTSSSQSKAYFLGSDQVYRPEIIGHKNNMKFGDTHNGFISSQEKYRLIPGGEDLAFVARILLRATNQTDTLDYFSYAKGVLKGPKQLEPFVTDDGKTHIAAAVCSSIIAPQDYRAFTKSGATVFTNSASLTTFNGSVLFSWQQKSLARAMATANARYFVQSANSATAFAMDNNGHLFAEVGGINTLDVTIRNNTKMTPYTRIGEWLVWLGAVVLVYLAVSPVIKFINKYKKYRSEIISKN